MAAHGGPVWPNGSPWFTMSGVTTTRIRSGLVACIAVLVCIGLVTPANAAPADSSSKSAALVRLLERRIHDPRIGSDFAMVVTDAETGDVVWSHSPNMRQRAASNMKIVTAVNALATMGPSKRFVTRVRAAAAAGHIILQGAGDPLLYRSEVEALAVRTAESLKKGSRVVVHVDGDLFYPPRRGPGWTPGYDNYLIASVQALAMFGDRSHQPSLNAARVFTARLRAKGIDARIGRDQNAGPGTRTIARTRGHTVAQAVGVMLSQSESNVAEVLFRQAAVALGLPATWSGGIAAAKNSLASIGVDTSNVRLFDGSGLSRKDRLTPRFLVDLLRAVKVLQGPRFAAMFEPSAMPIAGRTGTLATPYGRYDTYPSRCAAGRVQAKTGTLYDTIALSGVARTVDGRRLLFSMIVNNRPNGYSKLSTRRALDGLAATITGCWR